MAEAKHKENKSSPKKQSTLFWSILIIGSLAVIAAVLYFYNKELTQWAGSVLIEKPDTWSATLYFGDERSDFLIPEFRTLTAIHDPAEKAAALVQELIHGPTARGVRTVPRQTKIIWSKTGEDGLLRINFGTEMIQYHPGGSTAELLTVYSIVNTITTNVPEIKKVQLLFDGNPSETIAGHFDCSVPISPRPELVH
jgi:spore germination protein GerM